jgi:ubiquitin C-terminal hydrolase
MLSTYDVTFLLTAYTRRWNESGMEDKWVEFDDENVNDVDGNAIVSPSAYVLFYRRRSFR